MLFLVNEAWTATSQGGPRPNNTQCIQNNRRAIIHTDADYILPEHICTVVGRWVRQLLLMLFFCKLNLADTNLWFSCNRPYVFSLLSQKFRDDIWEPNTSTQVLVDNVKLEWYQQVYARCLCCPLGRTRLRHRLISVVDHTHRKSHLHSHWVMSIFSCLALFTLTMTRLNYSCSL